MRRSHAFTLVELLVVASVVGLLAGILLPALASSRRAARRVVCTSNLHQLGLAADLYLEDHAERYWPYFTDVAGGRLWWFGFETGGPNAGVPNRPLDKTRGILASYVSTTDDRFQCPSFPYNDPDFFPKFDRRSASYGYNVHLTSKTRTPYDARTSEVFVFADGIHFDQRNSFNEGHYLQYTPNTAIMSGYAHFRHRGTAQLVLMDGHVEAQHLHGQSHRDAGGGASGNLAAPDGSDAVYGR